MPPRLQAAREFKAAVRALVFTGELLLCAVIGFMAAAVLFE
jgi:hypothetical protein